MKTTPILQLPYPESTDSADVPRDIQALAQKLDGGPANGVFIIGEIRFIAIVATPTGWLPCDGAAVSRATYAALFAAVQSLWGGGDGSTTFNVPDLRGRAPVGAGQGKTNDGSANLANRAVGAKWGVEAVALTVAQIPAHNHSIPNGAAYFGVQSPSGAGNAILQNQAGNTGNTGGGANHENTQPSLAIPAYIYAGV